MKKIISLISTVALVFSMATVSFAVDTTPKVVVDVTEQTDSTASIAIKLEDINNAKQFLAGATIHVSIPADVLKIEKAAYSEISTTDKLLVPVDRKGSSYVINSKYYTNYYIGTPDQDQKAYNETAQTLSMSLACNAGLEIADDGVLFTFNNLPLAAAVATDIPIKITGARLVFQDEDLDYAEVVYACGEGAGITAGNALNVQDDKLEGAAKTYAVTVTGGTADVETAAAGDTVTITPGTAPEGQEFDSVVVKDADDKDVTVTESNGEYTFTMPASAVTVTVNFKATTPAEFCTVANNGAPTVTYYTEDDKKVEVFDCQTNKEAAGNTWYFTFVKNGVEREFQGDMTTIAGGANVIFKAWMISADGGVTLKSVTDAQ